MLDYLVTILKIEAELGTAQLQLVYLLFVYIIVKTQRNATQLNATLKQLALELDIVVMCSPPPHYHKLFSHF